LVCVGIWWCSLLVVSLACEQNYHSLFITPL
jgi:hypothetical protein